jgi:hypothetical protein
MTMDVIYAAHVIYVEDDIYGESQHLCAASHRLAPVIYDQNIMYGQKRHVWTAPGVRGKPIPGSAREPPWAIDPIAGIAMAQQH